MRDKILAIIYMQEYVLDQEILQQELRFGFQSYQDIPNESPSHANP
jgi:hypothetical protein